MNAFERYNIRFLSPTMIAQWNQAPATLVLRRIFGVKGKANANMWRGDAVEAGLQYYLGRRSADKEAEANAKTLAVETFWQRADGEVTEETEAAVALVAPMVEQAILATANCTATLMGSQFGIEHFLDGVSAAFTGRMDFLFDDKSIIELKATTRCPPSLETVSISHRWQAAFYAAARRQPVKLLYVTAKKHQAFDVMPDDESLHTLTRSAASLERALERAADGVSLLKTLPMNVGSFYWDEENLDAYEKAIEGDLPALSGPGTESLAAQGIITFGKHAGKSIKEVPDSYLNWLLNPKLSDGGEFDVPEELQDAIHKMREAA